MWRSLTKPQEQQRSAMPQGSRGGVARWEEEEGGSWQRTRPLVLAQGGEVSCLGGGQGPKAHRSQLSMLQHTTAHHSTPQHGTDQHDPAELGPVGPCSAHSLEVKDKVTSTTPALS